VPHNAHYIRCKPWFDHATGVDVPEWHCISSWDTDGPGRLRTEHSRVTYYRTLTEARRWARKYKVDCPEVMEPRRIRKT
jgi:hypothetical protein